MRDKEEFFNVLESIDGESYTGYSKLIGDFDFTRYVLKMDKVQHDNMTLLVVRVPQIIGDFPPALFSTPVRRTALEDYLTRQLSDVLDRIARYDKEGISRRRLAVAKPGQKILPRSSVVITDEYIEARISVDLPVKGGRIAGESAKELFFEDLPQVVNASLIHCNLSEEGIQQFVTTMSDADEIRRILVTQGLVGFIGKGALLKRRAESDERAENQTAFSIADELAVKIDLPHAGEIKGLGIPAGITVILGDAYSGRVELMKALAAGIYNHVPGDGREQVVTLPDAVYVQAEPGRSVQRLDMSAFVSRTMNHANWGAYSSAKADACTSQAAATLEALEVGARVLLYDESDSDASFLSSDSRLSRLMSSTAGAIPLSMRARQIVDELGVSIVIAGSVAVAEYISIADTVLKIEEGAVSNVTQDAKKLHLAAAKSVGQAEGMAALVDKGRWVIPSSIDPSVGLDDAYVSADDMSSLQFGHSAIDLGGISQLADVYQTATIGLILYYAKLRYMNEGRPIREILDLIDRDLSTEGMECLTRDLRGDLARPRRYEIAAALNRLDTLRIAQRSSA